MSTKRIDANLIAKTIIDLKKNAFLESHASFREIYEVVNFLQAKLDDENIDLVILDEVDDKLFEFKSGLYFYRNDNRNLESEAFYLKPAELVRFFEILESSKDDILNCIVNVKYKQIEKYL